MRPNLTRDEAATRARLISDPQYQIRLDLTTGEETFGSETTIRFGCSKPGASTFIDLVAAEVTRISLNGRKLPLEAFDGLRIELSGLAESNQLEVSARCAYSRLGIGLHRFEDPVDGRVYLHTHAEPFDIHRIFPCFDQPDIKGTFAFSVNAPKEWTVISNMEPSGRPAEGKAGEWSFPPTPRIPTYITAVVAGPYRVFTDRHRGRDLRLLCRESLAQYLDPEEFFEITKQGLDFFEEVFDYPYPFGKYDQAIVPEFIAGAMENAGCVVFNEYVIYRSRVTEAQREARASVILHEMAHMWFGDLVTMRWWDDLWLNESFATFMAALSLVRATRFTNAWRTFAQTTKAAARRQDQLPTTHPISADIPDVLSSKVNFDAITYSKGASVLRQLVAWVGEKEFLEGIKSYFRRHEYGNAELSDFLAALEESSGRDLRSWSKEWIETAGLNTLRPSFEENDGRYRSFQILQEAPPEHPTLRSHRVAVGLYEEENGALLRRHQVELDISGPRTEVPALEGEQIPDLLLLNDDDLTYAKIRLDDRSLTTVTSRLAKVTEPLARALVWAAAWDMTRDAELATRDWLTLVLNNIDVETDPSVIQNLLRQTDSGIGFYSDPNNQKRLFETLASSAYERLQSAEAGSDLQLLWARTFISAAQREDQVSVVKEILDGTAQFEGLKVDFDLRWLIVQALAQAGAAREDLIASELERDPTDQGRRHAAAARASQPHPEAKAEAWRLIVDYESLSLAMLRAIMGGFHRPDQADLVEPFAPRYFEALEPLWESRGDEIALAFARAMYPYPLIGEKLVAMTDQALSKSLPGPLRRLLLEGKDDVVRAIKARAKDASH